MCPPEFEPTILKDDGPEILVWERSYSVTQDRKVVAVYTRGHVPIKTGKLGRSLIWINNP